MFLWAAELEKLSTDRTKLPQVIQIYVHTKTKNKIIYSWTKSNVCAVMDVSMDDRATEEVIYRPGSYHR